jgi:hypothetical protein
MTIDQFLAKLRQIPGPWTVCHDGPIRRSGLTCPICAVLGRGQLRWWAVYRSLGLSYDDACRIAVTTDGEDDALSYDPVLRRQLLAATVERSEP